MGQKTHPNGLRVGIYRKWISSWYGSRNEQNKYNPSLKKNYYSSQGTISARGGNFFSNRDDFIENIFKRYLITKISFARRLILVDFRFFKGSGGQTYGFLFYTKLIRRQKKLYLYMITIYYPNSNYARTLIHNQKQVSYKKSKNVFFFFVYKSIPNFKKSTDIIIFKIIKNIQIFKKKFNTLYIKYVLINEFYLQKFSNFFRYNIVSFTYFCSVVFQKIFITFFFSYKNFFVKQKSISNFFSSVTKQNRFLFQRIQNIFDQTTLFVDNIFLASIVFFSKIHYTNKSIKIIKKKAYKRFFFSTKSYLTRLSAVRGHSIKFGRAKSNKIIIIKRLSQIFPNRVNKPAHNFFEKYCIPFFTSRTYFIQKFIVKKSWQSKFKFKAKFKAKVKKKQSIISSIFITAGHKGYKEIQPESFFFKLYSTNYQESEISTNSFNQLKLILSLITNTQFSFYFRNAVSLSRYAFDKEYYLRKNKKKKQQFIIKNLFFHKKGKRCSQRFLLNIEREITWRFRYVAIYIKDLIRIIFLSIYLKKATFIVDFFSYILAKLPRNRKETQFLRFLIKLVKIFSTHRREILGLRMRFQGRVNRWRRTKHIIGEKGSVSYSAYTSRIAYGQAQAITRKGAQGIRLWLCYQSFFGKKLRESIYIYAALSKKILIKKNKNAFKIKSKIIDKFNNKIKIKIKKIKINKIFSKYKIIIIKLFSINDSTYISLFS